jgi:hypothetical protein
MVDPNVASFGSSWQMLLSPSFSFLWWMLLPLQTCPDRCLTIIGLFTDRCVAVSVASVSIDAFRQDRAPMADAFAVFWLPFGEYFATEV